MLAFPADYTSLIHQSLSSDKDISEISKKVKERGIAWLIDHVVANTLKSAAELAIIRGSVESDESVFKCFEGHNINKLSADLQNLNVLVSNLRAQVSARDT